LRAVLDVNVLVSALLSPSGVPALILRAWRDGQFELIASPMLLAELERVLAYPKIARHVSAPDAAAFIAAVARNATIGEDPDTVRFRTADPADDYLVNLAASHNAIVVSGDAHVLSLAGHLPIQSPAEFLAGLVPAE
jgi:putative PIN family toxin of toxin-antitoxin system